MPRYHPPRCQAPDPEDQRTGRCGVEMRHLSERHPSFGPSYRPGCHVFLCPRCGAVRALEDTKLDRYVARVS